MKTIEQKLTILLAAILLGCIVFLVFFPPGSADHLEGVLQPPFEKSGQRFFTDAPRLRAFAADPGTTRLLLFEDGREIGPAGGSLSAIEEAGMGRFSFRQDGLHFSSSDRTDPNSNGRSYRFEAEVSALPLWASLAALVVTCLTLMSLIGMFVGQHLSGIAQRLALAANYSILIVALVEVSAWTLLQSELRSARPGHLKAFHFNFGGKVEPDGPAAGDRNGMQGTGLASNFQPHPFLNYTIDPDSSYMGLAQFNAEYLIRRSEPIRARRDVAWRALVLGGSTAFGAGIADERDTWVYQLEALVRKQHGQDFDVINGGIEGYSILDNILHYETHLHSLEPDLVILFTGINDVPPRLFEELKPDYSTSRQPWSGGDSKSLALLKSLSWTNVARLVALNQFKSGEIGHIYANIMKPYPPRSEWEENLRSNPSDTYRAHVEHLVGNLVPQGIDVLILPQIWMPRESNETDRIYAIAVREHNEVNRDVAREKQLVFLEELLEKGQFQRRHIFDNCHFNTEGNQHMAELLLDLMESKSVIQRRALGPRTAAF